MITLPCPRCQRSLTYPEKHGGQVNCPSCRFEIVVPEPVSQETDPLSGEGQEKLNGVRGAFLVLPFYMLGLLLLLLGIWQTVPVKGGGGAQLLFYLTLPLLGVAYKSIQCCFWLKSDPFKAVAIGRYLFLIYCVLWGVTKLATDWPTGHIEGPLDAFQRPEKFQVMEPNPLTYLGFLFEFGSEVVQKMAILAFLWTAYTLLRKDRQEYTWAHFWTEITFGRFGKQVYDHEGKSGDPSTISRPENRAVGQVGQEGTVPS